MAPSESLDEAPHAGISGPRQPKQSRRLAPNLHEIATICPLTASGRGLF